jgi:Tfp pilus assembly protein PilO
MIGRVPTVESEWIKRPLWLFLAIVLVIIAGNAVFSITGIARQSDEILSMQERIAVLKQGVKRPAAGQHLEGAISGVETFKARIPDHKGLTGVLNDIFRAARKNALQIPTGDYDPITVKETDISKYTIKFPVEGTYSQIKRFIYDIEVLPHILAVEEITFTSGKGEGTIALNIKVSTYFL